jgi:hypothetical protein
MGLNNCPNNTPNIGGGSTLSGQNKIIKPPQYRK